MQIVIKTAEAAALDLSVALAAENAAKGNTDLQYVSWAHALATDSRSDAALVRAVIKATNGKPGFSLAASSLNRDGVVGAILSLEGDTDSFEFPESLAKRWRKPAFDSNGDPIMADGKVVYAFPTVVWDSRSDAVAWSVPKIVRTILEPANNAATKGNTGMGKRALVNMVKDCANREEALTVLFAKFEAMVQRTKMLAEEVKAENEAKAEQEAEKARAKEEAEEAAKSLEDLLEASKGILSAMAKAKAADPAAAAGMLDAHIQALQAIKSGLSVPAAAPAA